MQASLLQIPRIEYKLSSSRFRNPKSRIQTPYIRPRLLNMHNITNDPQTLPAYSHSWNPNVHHPPSNITAPKIPESSTNNPISIDTTNCSTQTSSPMKRNTSLASHPRSPNLHHPPRKFGKSQFPEFDQLDQPPNLSNRTQAVESHLMDSMQKLWRRRCLVVKLGEAN